MDDSLPLEVLSPASLRALVTHERVKRAEAERDVARMQAGIARQNERLLELERGNAELRRTVATLQELVAGLTEQNAQLRGSERPPPHQPAPWPSERTKQEGEPSTRRRRDRRHDHGRHRMERVDVQVRHAVEVCPQCGTPLHGGWVHRRLQVIELPVQQRVQVIEHALLARRCPVCRCRVLPPPPAAEAGRIGHSRFGPRLLALVATMATVERLPIQHIQERLAREYDLWLSHGGIVGLLRLVAEQGKDAYEQLQQDIRGSPVVHADETGWRQDGVPGFIWSFSTPTTRYYHYDPSRAGTVPDAVVGADFGGTLVTDFYAAYDHFCGEKQRCWAHLWRDIGAPAAAHPPD